MGDKLTPADDKTSSPEVMPEGRTQKPLEISPETLAERKKAGEMEVKGKTMRGEADVLLNRLAERTSERPMDPETSRKITSVNFSDSVEKQKENIDALETVVFFMLADLFARYPELASNASLGNPKDAASILPKFINKSHPEGLSGADAAAYSKLKQMVWHLNAPVTEYFKDNWGELVATARERSKVVTALAAQSFLPTSAPVIGPLQAPNKKPESSKNGFIGTAVEFGKNHPIAATAIVAAGAFGLYKLFSWIKEKVSPTPSAAAGETAKPAEQKGGILKWILGIGATIAAFFGLGKLLGTDGFQKFVKAKFGVDLDKNRAAKALMLLANGKPGEAAEVLWQGVDENAEFHTKMAGIISKEMGKEVSSKTLFEMRNEKFEDFIGKTAQIKDEFSSTIGEWAGIAKPVAGLFLDSEQKNKEQIAVRGFLKNHESKVRAVMAVRDETTVDDVLKALSGEKPASATDAAGRTATGAAPAAAGLASAATVAALAKPDARTEKPFYEERDALANRLPEGPKRMAVEREKVLVRKIKFSDIRQFNEEVESRDEALRNLLAKNLKPAERKKVQAKIKTMEEQRKHLDRLLTEHAKAYKYYIEGLQKNTDEGDMKKRFADLIQTKEVLEAHYDEIFEREGWTELLALTATHGLKLALFTYRKFLKTSEMTNEHANYLFGKAVDTLRPEKIKERLAALRKPNLSIPGIDELKKETDGLFTGMQKLIDDVHAGSQGIAAEGLTQEHFEQLDALEVTIRQQQRNLERLWHQKQVELKAAIASANTTEQGRLLKEIQEIGAERSRLEAGAIGKLGSMFDRFKLILKGVGGKPEVKDKGVAAFRGFFRRIFKENRKPEGGISKILLRKGKLVVMAAGLVIGGEMLTDEKTGRDKAYAQAGLSMVPLAGTYLDFYSAIAGKEQLTGRKLDVTDRAISSMFGVAGLATDALCVFGIGFAGKGILTGLKAARGVKAASKIAKATESAKDAVSAAKAYKGYRALEVAGKWAFRVSLGTALGVPAYMAFTEDQTVDTSEDFRNEVVGDSIETAPEEASAKAA
ncbi:hypothetical protein HZA42_03345 [Candidatus Peregrinibacteria bacterium]|nr:hypothetical protein [Candidatus Peregrinibacteria bacterium]